MARLPFQEKTIKILFSHSGNQCAFPGCNQALVDGENVIGEICHIEAANEGGERYNSNQTDEERRHEKNLILLCANHHRITNNTEIYTVESLQKMKEEHKSKFRSEKAYKISDPVLEKIIQKELQQINTNNINGNVTNLTIQQIQNNNIKLENLKDYFLSLFNANFPRVHEEAMKAATLYVKRFAQQLLVALKSSGINVMEIERAFTDPDMHYVLSTTVQMVARSGKNEMNTILTHLIMIRIKNCEIENKKVLLNEAIATVNKLSINQLNIITASFLIYDHIKKIAISSWEELNSYLETYVKKFLNFESNEMDFRHIKYTGCASIKNESCPSYAQILKDIYPQLFARSIGPQKTISRNQTTDENLVCDKLNLGYFLSKLTMEAKLWTLDLSSIGIIIAAAHLETVSKQSLNIECYFHITN